MLTSSGYSASLPGAFNGWKSWELFAIGPQRLGSGQPSCPLMLASSSFWVWPPHLLSASFEVGTRGWSMFDSPQAWSGGEINQCMKYITIQANLQTAAAGKMLGSSYYWWNSSQARFLGGDYGSIQNPLWCLPLFHPFSFPDTEQVLCLSYTKSRNATFFPCFWWGWCLCFINSFSQCLKNQMVR